MATTTVGAADSKTISSTSQTAAAPKWTRIGTPTYTKARIALFLLGFASFSMIYCVQPLLPQFTSSFGISPANSALALSLTTGFLAVSIVLSSAFSQVLGRKKLMFVSMFIASILNIATALTHDWNTLVALRALEGFVLGGVPAVAMAWVAEEIHPDDMAKAMGVLIAGNAFGGMMGRVGMGLLLEYFSWQVAMGTLGVLCLAASLGFLALLPNSQNFVAQKHFQMGFHLKAWGSHLQNPRLLRLYALGFLITSIFVTTFNYMTFRLSGEPYALSPTQISWLFLCYNIGMVASATAGSLGKRYGQKHIVILGFALMLLGVWVTLLSGLPAIIVGIALVTFGFFIAHAIVSSMVGFEAKTTKGHASSLYLLFYYLGSSIVGSIGGWFWLNGGWLAIVALASVLCLIAMALSQLKIGGQTTA